MQRSPAVRKCEHSLIGLGLLSCLLSFSPRCGAQQDAQGANRDAISSLKTEIETLQQEQRQMETQLNAIAKLLEVRVAPSTAPTPISVKIQNEPFRGNRNASVAIVEFADFECPFCAQFARETYPKILDDYINTGKVVLFFKDFPLSGHPHALTAAEAARCAGDQGKYWVMHDDLFKHQADLSETGIAARAQTLGLDSAALMDCVSTARFAAEIQKSISDGEQAGITATPTFFVGSIEADRNEIKIAKAFRGAYPYDAFKSVLDGLLAQSNPRPLTGKKQ